MDDEWQPIPLDQMTPADLAYELRFPRRVVAFVRREMAGQSGLRQTLPTEIWPYDELEL